MATTSKVTLGDRLRALECWHHRITDRQVDDRLVVDGTRRRYADREQLGAAAQAVKPAPERADVEAVLRAERFVRLAATLELLDDLNPLFTTPPHRTPLVRRSGSSCGGAAHPAPGRTLTSLWIARRRLGVITRPREVTRRPEEVLSRRRAIRRGTADFARRRVGVSSRTRGVLPRRHRLLPRRL